MTYNIGGKNYPHMRIITIQKINGMVKHTDRLLTHLCAEMYGMK